MTFFIRGATEDPLQIEFLRDKKSHKIAIHRVFNGSYKAIGITPLLPKEEEVERVSLFQAFGDATKVTVRKTKELLGGIGMLCTGKVSLKDNVSGPVTILRLFYNKASKGLEDLLLLVAGISLMLFIMNLLPIPLVDGGQIVLCIIEGIKRGPVSLRIQDAYQKVGIVMILGLFGLAFFNDFKNIFLEVHNHIR
jgi:regulator of sigma E protease